MLRYRFLEILLVLLLAFLPVVGLCASELVEEEDMVTAVDGTRYTQAQLDSLRMTEDFVQFSLVIIEPEDVLYSALGHACLRMRCETFGIDHIFTYEGEDVSHQISRFLMGKLRMRLFETYTDSYLQLYRDAHRGVTEYAMHLPPKAELRLCEILENEADGDDKPYDYYHYGCVRSIVRAVREALGDTPIHYAAWPEKYLNSTQRELCYNAGNGHEWAQFSTFTLIGNGPDDVSIPCEEKLLAPCNLLEVWQLATVEGHTLVDKEAAMLVESGDQYQKKMITPMGVAVCLAILALLALVYTWTARWSVACAKYIKVCKIADGLVMMVVALLSVLMTYLVVISSLPCSDWNWLIVPFNILPLLAWPWRKYWAIPFVAVLAGWVAGMLCAPHCLVAPAHIVLAIAYILTLLRQVEWSSGTLSERKLRKL